MRRIYDTSYEPPEKSKAPSIPHPQANQIRVGALLAWVRWLSLFAFVIVGGISLLSKDAWLPIALILLGVHLVSLLLFFLFASGLRCRVCTNPVLLSSRAHKSSHAKMFFGLSHPLQVATNALFSKHFTCMYCGGKIRISKRR